MLVSLPSCVGTIVVGNVIDSWFALRYSPFDSLDSIPSSEGMKEVSEFIASPRVSVRDTMEPTCVGIGPDNLNKDTP